jgi:flagellar basal body P-ring formation protein FlgA
MIMIRISVAAFMGLLAFAAVMPARSATLEPLHPVLKSAAVVTSGVVRVGDLVEHAGIIANIPIFRSPDLGATGTVSAEAVAEAVREHALVGLDTAGLTEVSVTRASRAIEPAEIDELVTHALATRYTLGADQDIALHVDRELRTIHVDPGAKGEPRVGHIDYNAVTGRFAASIEIPISAGSRTTLRVTGRATVTAETLAVAHPVARGEVLKQSDVIVERRDRREVRGDILKDPEQAVGLAARNALEPGRPLRVSDLMKPQVVQRNEMVTLVYRVPGIMLTVRGKATENGAEGDLISVLNEQSKRTVQGIVSGPGRVIVAGTSARLAANIATTLSLADGR